MQKFSWHSRWQAFKGDSTNEKDLIFSAKISSIFQFTTKLDIFLANNISEEVCDFRMKTNFMESTCDIFAGQSSTLVAQVKPISSCFSLINIDCIHFSKIDMSVSLISYCFISSDTFSVQHICFKKNEVTHFLFEKIFHIKLILLLEVIWYDG